jgi:hypothetical protein
MLATWFLGTLVLSTKTTETATSNMHGSNPILALNCPDREDDPCEMSLTQL